MGYSDGRVLSPLLILVTVRDSGQPMILTTDEARRMDACAVERGEGATTALAG
jgi:hypothetical protein